MRNGTRVRLKCPSHVLRLESNTGTVICNDVHLDYVLVKLDQPAVYDSGTTNVRLEIVREDEENLEAL